MATTMAMMTTAIHGAPTPTAIAIMPVLSASLPKKTRQT